MVISQIMPNSPEKPVAFASKMPPKEEKDCTDEVKGGSGEELTETARRGIELHSLSTVVEAQQKPWPT